MTSNTATQNFTIIFFLVNTCLIIYLTLHGVPANSLHSSALAWAYGSNIVSYLAYAFNYILPNISLAFPQQVKKIDQ